MSSNSQITANQINAQHSTGPTSPDGKAASSLNALKHGVFSESPIIPGEDPAALEALARSYERHFDPQGPVEEGLVKVIVATEWQVRRFDRIESLIVCKYVADSGKSEDEAIAELYMMTRGNPLHRLQQRRNAAQNHWFRALRDLQRLQKARGKSPETQAAPVKNGFVPPPYVVAPGTSLDSTREPSHPMRK